MSHENKKNFEGYQQGFQSRTSNKKYLKTYPIEWPVFSTKNYTRDSDGWWNFFRVKRQKDRFLSQTIYNMNEEDDEEDDEDQYEGLYEDSYENENANVNVDTSSGKKPKK